MKERPDTFSDSDREELLRLLGEVLDDNALKPEGRARLNELLSRFSEAREIYRQHSELHARLHLDYTGGLAPEAMPGEQKITAFPESQSRRTMAMMAAVVAASLLALGIAWKTGFVSVGENSLAGEELPVSDGVAVLSRALGIEWNDPGEARQEGDALGPGRFRIASGIAEIEFFDGASVILEGPAELEILSESRARLHGGRLRASVPEPAQGFLIEGPGFDAVDLGTEFAMSLDPEGRSEVHVIDGEVALHKKGGGPFETLTTGRGARIGGDTSAWEALDGGGGEFVDRERLLRMSDERGEFGYTDWRRHRMQYIDDPDTIVYFDFEDQVPWDRELHNARKEGSDAAIIGARWVTGRWPGKGALEIKRVSDRIRLDIPGEFEAFTLMAWVRVEGLDRRYNSLFLTDGWGPGESHWQIGNRGQLILGIKNVGSDNTAPVVGPGDLGRWLHLAVTFDSGEGIIRHYRDGMLVDSFGSFSSEIPLVFGPSEIGNWQTKGSSKRSVRSFNGRIDEFLISRRAMSPAEIQEHYEAGNPYR